MWEPCCILTRQKRKIVKERAGEEAQPCERGIYSDKTVVGDTRICVVVMSVHQLGGQRSPCGVVSGVSPLSLSTAIGTALLRITQTVSQASSQGSHHGFFCYNQGSSPKRETCPFYSQASNLSRGHLLLSRSIPGASTPSLKPPRKCHLHVSLAKAPSSRPRTPYTPGTSCTRTAFFLRLGPDPLQRNPTKASKRK